MLRTKDAQDEFLLSWVRKIAEFSFLVCINVSEILSPCRVVYTLILNCQNMYMCVYVSEVMKNSSLTLNYSVFLIILFDQFQ